MCVCICFGFSVEKIVLVLDGAQRKLDKKNIVLCHRMNSQITLAAPRLGAEDGVSRTTKIKNEHEKLTDPCLSLAARLLRPLSSTEWRRSAGRRNKKSKQTKGTIPGPALSGEGR